MTYQFITEHHGTTPVKWMCHAIEVAASGYYAWRKRPPSHRDQEDSILAEQIEQIHQASRQTYGSLRIQAAFRARRLMMRTSPDRHNHLACSHKGDRSYDHFRMARVC